jgi:hypothetical protein
VEAALELARSATRYVSIVTVKRERGFSHSLVPVKKQAA